MHKDNHEVETKKLIQRNILMTAIVGPGGSLIRDMQRTLEVRLDFMKSEPGAPRRVQEELTIKGTTARVAAAEAHINALIVKHMSETSILSVPESVVPAVVGKGGAVLKAIRAEFPGTTIDVEDNTITIHSVDFASRDGARLAVERIVDANFSEGVAYDGDTMIALKGARGAECRAALTSLGLNAEMSAEKGIITLRGNSPAVRSGFALLETFAQFNNSEKVPLTSDEAIALSQGGSNGGSGKSAASSDADADVAAATLAAATTVSLRKRIENDYNVDTYLNAKEGYVMIRGTATAIESAKKGLQAVFNGSDGCSCVVRLGRNFPFPSLIGKGGSNIKKLEEDNDGVRLDMLRDTGKVRIRGETQAQAEAGKWALLAFIDTLRSFITIEMTSLPGLNDPHADKHIERVSAAFPSVDVRREGKKIRIRGGIFTTERAQGKFVELHSGKGVRAIAVAPSTIISLAGNATGDFNARLASIAKSSGCKVYTENGSADASRSSKVHVEGPSGSVDSAVNAVRDLLKHHSANSFVSLPLSAEKLLSVCQIGFITEMSERCNVVITVDTNANCIDVACVVDTGFGQVENPAITQVKAQIARKLLQWSECNTAVAVPDHLFSSMVGKSGSVINALQKDTCVNIKANRASLCFDISSDNAAAIALAKYLITKKVVEMEGQYWSSKVDANIIGGLIGKKGAYKLKIQSDSGASIDIDVKSLTVRVHSEDQEKLANAKEIIEKYLAEEGEKNYSVQLVIPPSATATLIGAKGATARSIQNDYSVRFDLDKSLHIATLKGRLTDVESAQQAIKDLLSGARHEVRVAMAEDLAPPPPARVAAMELEREESDEGAGADGGDSTPKTPPAGALTPNTPKSTEGSSTPKSQKSTDGNQTPKTPKSARTGTKMASSVERKEGSFLSSGTTGELGGNTSVVDSSGSSTPQSKTPRTPKSPRSSKGKKSPRT